MRLVRCTFSPPPTQRASRYSSTLWVALKTLKKIGQSLLQELDLILPRVPPHENAGTLYAETEEIIFIRL